MILHLPRRFFDRLGKDTTGAFGAALQRGRGRSMGNNHFPFLICFFNGACQSANSSFPDDCRSVSWEGLAGIIPTGQLLPIRTPVARTSPPPSITLAAAEIGGVSMYFHWIKAIAKSSTTTITAAIAVAV
jgi:hypothetical protein